MRAAVIEQTKTRIPIRDLEIQEPGQGEVLLDMVGAGVCHSDYHFIDGHMQPWGLPWVMGHEGAGVVREVGPRVSSVAPGDKIILSLDPMCGYCRNCSLGSPALCETYPRVPVTRMTLDGKPTYHMRPTFAEQTIALADACVKVPDDTNLRVGCLISCGVITGVGAVVNRAKVEPGASMAVFGCGGVGLNVVQGGVLASAGKIIAVDKVPYKLELAEQMGATHFVNAEKEDPVERIKEITGGGADYAFEVVGLPCPRPAGPRLSANDRHRRGRRGAAQRPGNLHRRMAHSARPSAHRRVPRLGPGPRRLPLAARPLQPGQAEARRAHIAFAAPR